MSESHPTGAYEIRPLSLAETLDAGFQILKNHFGPLFALNAIAQAPTVLFFSQFDWMFDPFALQSGEIPEIGATFLVAIGVYMLLMLILMPIVIGAITAAVSDAYLGNEIDIADCLRRGLARMVPLMITYVIFTIVLFVATFIVVFAIAMLVVGGAALLRDSALGIGLLVLLFVLGVPAAFALGGLLLLVPGVLAAVVVLEKLSLFEAVARTAALVWARVGQITGIGVVVWMLLLVGPTGAQFMVGSIPVLGVLVWGGVQALCQAYLYATTVIAYFDVRCRTESFDLEHLAQLVEGRAPSAAPLR